jgi:quercetin dioxygenase-like cupin family protein
MKSTVADSTYVVKSVSSEMATSAYDAHQNLNSPRKRIFVNPVIGDRAILVKSGEETDGEYTLFQIEVAAGGGNTLHIHKTYNETFKVLDGELSVQLGKEHHTLHQGDSLTVPKNESHCFSNMTNTPTKFLVEFRPAQPGFEKAIAIAYGLAVDGLVNKKSMPKKFSHLAILIALSGTVPSGLGSFFVPLFQWFAKRFPKTEQELITKYC